MFPYFSAKCEAKSEPVPFRESTIAYCRAFGRKLDEDNDEDDDEDDDENDDEDDNEDVKERKLELPPPTVSSWLYRVPSTKF
jgi:hypothetical protein